MRHRSTLIQALLTAAALAAPLHALEYVESSAGLVPPSFEGGRTELEFADVNADGHVDLLSIGDHGSPYIGTDQHGIMVWFGNGAGQWSVHQSGDFGYGGIAVGDVDNDGLLDAGYAMHHNYSGTDFGDQLIEVALGDGTGMNWAPWDGGLATNGEDWGMFGTDFADVDNDGDLDVGSASFGCCAGIHVYLNNGDGSWTQSFGILGGNSYDDFEFGDINRDGNADIATKYQNGAVYFGDGSGGFTAAYAGLPSYAYNGISLGDVDDDGGDDVAFCISTPSHGVRVWTWDDELAQWSDFSGTLPTTGGFESTQLFDANADGHVDLAAFGGRTFALWLGDGSGNWVADATFTTPPAGSFQAFRVGGDVDHNGYPDVALVDEEGSWPSYQNHLRCYRETSVAQSLAIAPVFPRGGERFAQGSVHFIDWVSGVPGGSESWVSLEYSTTGSMGPWVAIAENLPNSGRYQWVVPPTASMECFVRYTVETTGGSAHTITARAFAILPAPTGIDEGAGAASESLLSCAPNPFAGSVSIHFATPESGRVVVSVYDVSGRLVRTLFDSVCAAGTVAQTIWDGTGEAGEECAGGVYFCRAVTPGCTQTRSLVLLK